MVNEQMRQSANRPSSVAAAARPRNGVISWIVEGVVLVSRFR